MGRLVVKVEIRALAPRNPRGTPLRERSPHFSLTRVPEVCPHFCKKVFTADVNLCADVHVRPLKLLVQRLTIHSIHWHTTGVELVRCCVVPARAVQSLQMHSAPVFQALPAVLVRVLTVGKGGFETLLELRRHTMPERVFVNGAHRTVEQFCLHSRTASFVITRASNYSRT
jgi:hypothetical protein